MPKNLYIDASRPNETRVVLKNENFIEDYEYESINNTLIKNNIYLGKVSRVEPSLQAAFVDFGRERHGFLSFNDIQSDYYQLPQSDLEQIKKEEELVREELSKESQNLEEVESDIPKMEIPSIKLLDDSKKIESENKISKSDRFYSPLVKSIAKKENISLNELDQISGSGKDGRVTKQDILNYIKGDIKSGITNDSYAPTQSSVGDQIVELDRMGKIIFNHMSDSKKISAHVQSFVEVDVSNVWDWREKYKTSFQENEGQKLTFTPIFISAVVKSLKDFPILNSSVVDDKIVIKRSINIGMATAVDNGNLIVPVIKNADHLNLKGLAIAVNDLSKRARSNSLKPEEISDGTYTVTNVGNFGSIMGTPIINQPQVGIIAIGVIRKLPSVIETDKGDFVGIRKKLILSHTYDHRIINGSIGGSFVKRVAEYLEEWDMNQTI